MQGFDMNKMIQMAQQMQQKLQRAQEELEHIQVEGEAAGSGVKVVLNGQGEVVRVIIPKEAIDPDDPAMLEDLLLVAMQTAQKKQREKMQEHLANSTGLPLSNLPFL